MGKCQKCGANLTWAVNLKTLKKVPLVPFKPEYEKAVRYDLSEPRSDGERECSRNDNGAYMSHFADCPSAAHFSGRNKQK
jgi:hypothetical protein